MTYIHRHSAKRIYFSCTRYRLLLAIGAVSCSLSLSAQSNQSIWVSGLNPVAELQVKNQKSDREIEGLRGRVKAYCESVYSYEGKLSELKEYVYDSAGRKTEETRYDCSPAFMGRLIERSTWAFDGKGNPVKEARYVYGTMVESRSRKYNALGQMTEQVEISDESSRDGASGNRNYRSTYKYDARGNLLEIRSFKNSSSTPYYVRSFRYNDRDHRTEQRVTEKGRTDIIRHEFVYNAKGDVLKYSEYRESGIDSRIVLTYNEQGALTSEIRYERASADTILNQGAAYFYTLDDKGRVTGQKYMKAGVLNEVIENTYSKEGLAETVRKRADGSPISVSRYADGRLIEKTEYLTDGGKRQTSWSYDAFGNQLYEADQFRNEPLSYRGGKFSYIYDSRGNWTGKTNVFIPARPELVQRRELRYFEQ